MKKWVTFEELPNVFKSIASQTGAEEFAVVKNPNYIYSPFEVYPLAPKIKAVEQLKAAVMDMDGTTTTTEPLCLHSLEFMVRAITDRMDPAKWSGLDREKDYPHIIGNSTTRHVEYLIDKYGTFIVPKAFIKSYIEAALWTLSKGQDEGRKREVETNLEALGLSDLRRSEEFKNLIKKESWTQKNIEILADKYGKAFKGNDSFNNRVRAAIDVYYWRYHSILRGIGEGKGAQLSREILGKGGGNLVEPMPGVGIYLSLIKGLLRNPSKRVYEILSEHVDRNSRGNKPKLSYEDFVQMSLYFQQNPVKVGVVTSSIYYEANVVLTEVFRVIREQIPDWGMDPKTEEVLLQAFASPHRFYDAFITASDSSEIRLKPHRDLYSIALHLLGITPEDFDKVVGFEDSESGTIAIRAAGIGLCVAVPFSDTGGHDFWAATYVVWGGLPEVTLCYGSFLTKFAKSLIF